jgi:hypothetical protein
MEHIRPKSRGGSNRVTNLVMACVSCNRQKDSSTLEEFLAGDQVLLQKILAQVRVPLRDAAAVNTTRWALFQALEQSQLPVTTSSGGRTKWNRSRLGIPKTHALDALCVGLVDAISQWMIPVLAIKAAGRGAYQRTLLTKHGFPRGYLTRQKQHYGVQTGDFVVADIKTGKRAGVHKGRVAIRASGYFNIQTVQGVVQGVSHRYCRLLHRADGYGYSQQRDKKQESGEGHTIPPRPTGRGIPRS